MTTTTTNNNDSDSGSDNGVSVLVVVVGPDAELLGIGGRGIDPDSETGMATLATGLTIASEIAREYVATTAATVGTYPVPVDDSYTLPGYL